jgi:acetoin utilization protein AcuC
MGEAPGRSVSPRRAAFIYTPRFEQYHYPDDCPFSTDRAPRARKTLAGMGLLAGEGRREVACEPASRDDLRVFHWEEYLDALAAAAGGHLGVEGLMMDLGTADTPVFADMYDYAALACGASLKAAELVLSGEADVAFNPSGGYHHARAGRAAGFCYLNDVVLACEALAGAGKRVLFFDCDAHHSDGVQEAFYERPDVMTLSMHESGRTLYPGTGFEEEIGQGAGRGYAVNIPLPVGTYDEAYLLAFREVVEPLAAAFDPDAIVMELGMDSLAGDPLTHLCLTNNAYAEVISRLLSLGRPVVAVGGGGYHVANAARGWALAWSVLCGADPGGPGGGAELSAGLGGVMMGTTEWQGGLRDRVLIPDAEARMTVPAAVEATIAKLKAALFPLHGL